MGSTADGFIIVQLNSYRESRIWLTLQQEHILQLMAGVLYRLIKLVGACGTSSSIDSHITYSFLNSAFDVQIKVLLILTKTNATPRPAKSPPPTLFLSKPLTPIQTAKEAATTSATGTVQCMNY